MSWLVTGGAGYIGAHVVAAMREAGEDVVVLDDLSTGERSRIGDVPLAVGSVLDEDLVRRVLRQHHVRGIVHLAAKRRVEESVRRPLFYYRQNVEGLRALLAAALACDVESFVFSSSAAVYGSPDVDMVTEASECRPVSPYGRTKLLGERMLADVAAASGLRYATLRYFNVAGAGSRQLIDRAVANLVPMVFRELEQRRPPRIFGSDYPTPDGTCVRDFVHVADVASAHVAAAGALADGRVTALTANIGRGRECPSARSWTGSFASPALPARTGPGHFSFRAAPVIPPGWSPARRPSERYWAGRRGTASSRSSRRLGPGEGLAVSAASSAGSGRCRCVAVMVGGFP